MNIIGKIFLIINLILNTSFLISCDLNVLILDHNGKTVDRVLVGVPFFLQVVGKGDCEITKVDFDSGFEVCKLSSLGIIKSLNSVNGVNSRTTTYKYSGRIDLAGKYELGAITVWSGQQQLGSLQVALNVVEEKSNANLVNGKKLALELKTDLNQLYLGEQFVIKVNFCPAGAKLIGKPNLNLPSDWQEMLDFKLVSGPNLQAGCWEWQIVARAKKTGPLMLPAAQVIFEQQDVHYNFFSFTSSQPSSLFSNILKLTVLELPFTKHVVHGIGQFTGFIAQIDRHEINANQAAQLTLILAGSGNWDQIEIPSLVNLPPQIQAYAGRVSYEHDSYTVHKKFEFILHGISDGECLIPAQAFYYFDTQARQYKTLLTMPIKLNILAAGKNSTLAFQDDLTSKLNQVSPLIISFDNSWLYQFGLPIYLFICLLWLPTLFFVARNIYYFLRYQYQNQKKIRLKKFKKQLLEIESQYRVNLLDDFFSNLILNLFDASQRKTFKPELESFLQQIHQLKYSGEQVAGTKLNDIFEQAHFWFDYLSNLALDQKNNLRHYFFAILVLVTNLTLAADRFLQANLAYQAGDFAKAQQLYQELDLLDNSHAAIQYNLGNSFFQQEKFVLAIVNWLKVCKIGNLAQKYRAKRNILITQKFLYLAQQDHFDWPNIFDQLINLQNFLIWQTIILLILAGLFFALFKLIKYRKLIWHLIILLQLVITIMVILCAKENKLSYAVVQNDAEIVAGPSSDYHILGNTKQGQIFKVLYQMQDWCLVQARGRQGWLAKKDLYII